MADLHAPSPEFTDFLEWQTRTELRRRQRFAPAAPRRPRLLGLARAAALVFVSLFAGAGVVVAVERIQDSRELTVLLERNRLLVELAERRVDVAHDLAETARVRYEQGLTTSGDVGQAQLRVAALERGRDRLRLDREELLAARREVDPRLSAPLVGSRDFVSQRLRVERAFVARSAELLAEAEELARLRFEAGVAPQVELERARRDTARAGARLARLEERLALRADFLVGRLEAQACELRDLVGDAEHRRAALRADAEHLRWQLELAEAREAMGAGAGLVAPLREQLDGVEVELRLVELELELLR